MDVYRLTAIISVVRHGEKDVQGQLTEKGKQQAVARGIKTQFLSGGIKLYSSGVPRVGHTVAIMGEALPQNIVDVVENTSDSIGGSSLRPETLEELHFELHLQEPSSYFSSWTGVDETPEQQANRMQSYLQKNSVSPEPTTVPAPKLMAQRLSRVLARQIREAVATPCEVTLNIINGTHEPVIMAFLFYVLNGFEPGSEHFVSVIGGTVQYSEGFDIHVYQKTDGSFRCFLSFRKLFTELELSLLESFGNNI